MTVLLVCHLINKLSKNVWKKRFLNLFNIMNVKHFLCVKNETGYEFSIKRQRYGLMDLFIFELNEKKVNDDKRFRFHAFCGSRSCATYL